MNSTKTNLLMKRISKKASKLGVASATGALTIGMLSGCTSTSNPNTVTNPNTATNSNLPPTPGDNSCRDWEWSDEYQVWECDDYKSSSHSGHAYYYGGSVFKNSSGLLSNSKYKSYKASSSFKNQGTVKSSSGSGVNSSSSQGTVKSPTGSGVSSSNSKGKSVKSSSKSGIGSKSSGFGG